jgi:hypothetical protein
MQDLVLTAPANNRYTYFVAFYGQDFQKQTAVLYVCHGFQETIQTLHVKIRQRIGEILGQDTPTCYHILAMAAPESIAA